MKQLTITLLITLISILTIHAQKDETILSKTSLRITGAWGGPTIGITGYTEKIATVTGGYGGIEFNKEYFIGWGGATIDYPRVGTNLSNPNFNYNGLVIGYAPSAHRVIHPSFLLLLGKGQITLFPVDDKAWVVQPAIGGEVNVLRWFRVGVTSGYRYVGGNNFGAPIVSNYSGFFGEIKLKFGFSWGKSDRYKNRDKYDDTDA